ncbi:cytosolic carboxypeptidase 4 isoform X1 [Tachysurus vachellii]|uniref:cytosolic carboxypeptidase 4 isoform X1 n=2 Tax=Tachysurus vachellii TaxID=175792 RepID=UPI00296AC494|nr:cytosolic carboxypeptidase 4 isoform X1 [Tachysurus vachellii]
MFSYGRPSVFTWTGTLRECVHHPTDARPTVTMASPSSSGLEVLLSTLENAEDIENMLNILNVLDELLSAGTDRRINYMISKGGSEALLSVLVKTARSMSPNFTLLLPTLHLLTKVGHRDRMMGVKAEKADAVLLTLRLLQQNSESDRRAAACLWVIATFCSSVSTATLLGENQALDVVFKLITPPAAKHTHMVKAAVHAFAALLSSKENGHLAVEKGYISALVSVYEDWHKQDTRNKHLAIRRAFLHCLHRAAKTSSGRHALVSEGGVAVLYNTTQACLLMKDSESLVESALQLMRKCLPKLPLPLSSGHSTYSFLLPGHSEESWESDSEADDVNSDDDSDDEQDNEEPDYHDYEEDLETDVNKLKARPDLDRPKEQLDQYSHFCPELHHNFQDLDSGSERDASPDVKEVQKSKAFSDNKQKQEEADLKARDFQSHFLKCSGNQQEACNSMLDSLLGKYSTSIPHHDPRLYSRVAAHTKSVATFSILAFPDFWGHFPPAAPERMATRRPHIQRKKVFEDIQRFICPDDIINKVVFDIEDQSPNCSIKAPTDSLRFFSKFENGNLRKALHIRRHEYDLILNADVNSSTHQQWFYFEVSGMMVNVPYRFNVINCEKSNSQFNYGMQPVVYSVKEALEGRPQWVRTGSEICYYRNHFQLSKGHRGHCFYTLTFTITFSHEDDVCYVAYHYPYTFSALQSHLQMMQHSIDPQKIFFRHQILCNTLGGNACPLITITATPTSHTYKHLHQLRNRPCVFLTARVHPGECNSSWVMKGTLEFLCSDDAVAESLRETFIFKIVPMLNPDGVIHGNHRCSLSADDLNRQWLKPSPVLSPTIYHTKGLLYYLCSIGKTPLVFCDYHGHSRKKNVFLYGCSVKETLWQSGSPINTASLKEDPGYRTIAKTLDRIAPAFSFNNCNFLVEKSRASTARVVVWREMEVLRSYTMESTFNGCNQGIYKDLQTGTRELEEMGMKFCQSLLTLRKNSINYSSHLIGHAAAILDLDNGLMDHKSHNCFEDDEPPCVENIEYSSYTENLSANELDEEVDRNTRSGDEVEDGEDGSRKSWCRKSSVFPRACHQDPLETQHQQHLPELGAGQKSASLEHSCFNYRDEL